MEIVEAFNFFFYFIVFAFFRGFWKKYRNILFSMSKTVNRHILAI